MQQRITDKAQASYNSGLNCCQSVLNAMSGLTGLDADLATGIGAAFVAGMNYEGERCGAVIGSYMSMGLLSKKLYPHSDLGKEMTYQNIKTFNAAFKQRHGSLICKELLGKDISQTKGLDEAIQSGVFETRCPLFIKAATEILSKIFKL